MTSATVAATAPTGTPSPPAVPASVARRQPPPPLPPSRPAPTARRAPVIVSAAAHHPRVAGVGTAVSGLPYSQQELLELFGITDDKVRSVFSNSAIDRRFLTVPDRHAGGGFVEEPQGALLAKHRRIAVDMAARAVRAALADAGLRLADVDYLCCVTSTGFLTPGISALLIRELGADPGCHRVDVVGMGCNAGLNALNGTASWADANPGRVAVMVCAEACSAAYVMDASMRTAVVNSLFGDGSAAIVLIAGEEPATDARATDARATDTRAIDGPAVASLHGGQPATGRPASGRGPRILGFASHLITEALDAMRYDWDDTQHKFSFFLDPDIPYVVGASAGLVVDRLLARAGLRRRDIGHWLVHSGGKKVIDAVRVNLGLTRHDVRHTVGVLRDYGNLSSGSFLFSYQRLLREHVVEPGDLGVLMTMGPGSTIETALVQW